MMKRLFVMTMLFLVACQSVEIIEVIPEQRDPPVIQIPDRPEQQPIRSQEFTLVESYDNVAIIAGEEIPLKLLGAVDERAQIQINQTTMLLEENASVTILGLEWTVVELAKDDVSIPRRSYADAFLNGARTDIHVNENRSFGNSSITVDFIGLQDGEPSARFVVGDESAILQEDGEHYFDEGFVYVQRIFFFDAEHFTKADAVTMSVSS